MATATADSNARRWSLLQDYGLLEGAGDARFDAVLRIAAQLCDTPMAALSFTDQTRERFVACHGCTLDKIPSAKGFSDYIISGDCALLVNDVRSDTRFRQAPLLGKYPDIRFYAGVPVAGTDGVPLGTLAVMDRNARHLPKAKLAALRALGSQVMLLLEVERNAEGTSMALMSDATGRMVRRPDFDMVFGSLPGDHLLVDANDRQIVSVSNTMLDNGMRRREDITGRTLDEFLMQECRTPEAQESARQIIASVRRVAQTGRRNTLIALPYPVMRKQAQGKPEKETRYWNVEHAPVRDPAGSVRYVVSHAVDVTELASLRRREGEAVKDRRVLQAQAAKLEQDILHRSREIQRLNEHLHMAQAVANVGSWALDLCGDASFSSDEIFEILGVDRKLRDSADPILDHTHPDDREQLLVARSLVEGGADSLEHAHRIVRDDGTVRFVHQHLHMSRGDDGKPAILYGTMQDITRQKAVEDELQTRARQQDVVARFGQKALTAHRLEDLLDEAAAIVTETLDVEYCKVLQLLPDGKAMKLVAGRGWREGLIGNAVVSIGRDSQAGYTLMQKHSVIVDDLRNDERFNGPELLRSHGVVSGISVIIAGKNAPWGALGAHSTHLRNFTQDDVNFFESIANILAEAAYLRRVTGEMSARNARVNALLQLSRSALQGKPRRELQALAARLVADMLGVEYSKIAEQLPDGSGMTVVAGVGWQDGVVGHAILSIGKKAHGGYVLGSTEPVVTTDLPAEKRFRPSPLLLDHGVDSGIALAIPGREGPVGMLGVHTMKRRIFMPEEIEFVREVATILAEIDEREAASA